MDNMHQRHETLLDELKQLLTDRGMAVEDAQYGDEVVLVGRSEAEPEGGLVRVAIHVSARDIEPDSSDYGLAEAVRTRRV